MSSNSQRHCMKILVIEDEIKIADFVVSGLQQAGFETTHAADGIQGLNTIMQDHYDLVVLDVMLPKMNGLDVLQQVRQQGNRTPIIILSAKSELPDRLTAFEHGVDDYLPKPFFVEELIARIKALLSRQSSQSLDQLTCGPLRLEVLDHKAHWHDVTAVLSQKEFSLLSYLMRSPGHIYSRKQILKHVWNIDFDPETNVVDVCIRRIRRKLSRHSDANEDLIESVRGVGYRLKTEDAR